MKLFFAIILAVLCATTCLAQATSHASETGAWRSAHEDKIKSDTGWLTVTGLFWLKEGGNTVGSSPDSSIVVPTARKRIGTFRMLQGNISLETAEGVVAMFQGKPVREIELTATTQKASPPVTVGDLTFILLKRGSRYAIRTKDKNSTLRKEFAGLRWYPINESYRVVADFEPFSRPTELPITNVLGNTDNYTSPGILRFKLKGSEYTLQPVMEGEKLFIIFNDLTTGKSTYGGGRFLYADKASGKTVVLDFNRAENPPCAFSEFTTCPLPPKQNRLKLAIDAGELDYKGPGKANKSTTH